MNEQEIIDKLDMHCDREYFDKVVSFAKSANRWEGEQGLKSNLERIISLHRNREGKAAIYKDFAPFSFGFAAGMFVGGLIFHGKHDGGGNGSAPSFSVSLEPCDGWSIHT